MRNLLALLLAPFLLISCSNQDSPKGTNNPNEKIITQYYENFNKHDWQKMAEMYADVSEFKDPSLGLTAVKQTRKEIIEKYSILGEMFKDVKDSVLQMYPSGDKHITVEFISTGTAPDGSKFELPICTIFTIEDGLITKDYTYYDNFGETE